MWKKKYRARVRCGAMDRNAPGESTRVQGETPFLPTAYRALLLKTGRLRTKSIIFFLCLFCFVFFLTASIESWDFFLNLLFAVLAVQLVSDYWSFSSINFSIYCHLKIYIYVQPTEFYWKGKIGDQIKTQRSDNGNERHNTKKIIRSIVWWSVKKMRLLLINLLLFLPKEFPHCR